MALQHLNVLSFQFSVKKPIPIPACRSTSRPSHIPCGPTDICSTHQPRDAPINRRSANYAPSTFDDDFVQTLNNGYEGEVHARRAAILKENVRRLLESKMKGPYIPLLELIDDIQRLGLGYIFKENIEIALDSMRGIETYDNLHATALHFRIFRQHGFTMSEDVFTVFMDFQGNFMGSLSKDTKGILSLYEASHLGMEGEDILDEAKLFCYGHLNNANANINSNVVEKVNHALEFPLHLNMTKLEARWYINTYSKCDDANLNLLELAKLDYNMVQCIHQKELIDMTRWWKHLGLAMFLPFARDKLVEVFLGSMGTTYEPEYKNCREWLTKIISFINVIDDIYDVYSTLEEAILFTDVVERWNVNTIDELPYYMKLSFLALHNTINDIGYHTLKEKGLNIVPFLRKMWVVTCKSYLVEAKWFHTGYRPTLDEYLENGWISIGGLLLVFNIYVLMCPNITTEVMNYLSSYNKLSYAFGMVIRLTDDMGTYQKELIRGDVMKSVTCYMLDKGVTEEVACKNIKNLTNEAWRKMNSELWTKSHLPKELVNAVINLARTTRVVYHNGDPCYNNGELKDKMLSLFVDNIPIP